jgi:NADPH2:quinone reductase
MRSFASVCPRLLSKSSFTFSRFLCSSSMLAARVHTPGSIDSIVIDSDVAIPTPSPSQVLIQVYYSGVNYIDTYHRTGLYKLPLPCVLGREGAGKVIKTGSNVQDFKEEDRVVFFAQGSYGQYCAAEASSVYRLPNEISYQTAAASFLQGLTAHYLATSSYKIQSGDNILIHAAAGGTGALLVQIAKLKGARVIATVGSQDKVSIAKSAGADEVIQYLHQDFQAEVVKLTNGKGVSAVYDGVGQATWQGSLKSLARLGTLVLFGNASGPVPPINPLDLTNQGSISLVRPSLQHYIATRDQLDSRSADLFSWLQSGQLKLNIAKEFDLQQAGEAHKALESRQFAGKIMLKIPQKE